MFPCEQGRMHINAHSPRSLKIPHPGWKSCLWASTWLPSSDIHPLASQRNLSCLPERCFPWSQKDSLLCISEIHRQFYSHRRCSHSEYARALEISQKEPDGSISRLTMQWTKISAPSLLYSICSCLLLAAVNRSTTTNTAFSIASFCSFFCGSPKKM